MFEGPGPSSGEEIEAHQDVVDEVRRPADCKETHYGEEHLDDLASNPMVGLNPLRRSNWALLLLILSGRRARVARADSFYTAASARHRLHRSGANLHGRTVGAGPFFFRQDDGVSCRFDLIVPVGPVSA